MPRLFFALQPARRTSAALIDAGDAAGRAAAGAARAARATCTPRCVSSARWPEKRRRLCAPRPRPCAAWPANCDFDALEYWEKPQVLCATPSPMSHPRRMRCRWRCATPMRRGRIHSRHQTVSPAPDAGAKSAAPRDAEGLPGRSHLTPGFVVALRKIRADARAVAGNTARYTVSSNHGHCMPTNRCMARIFSESQRNSCVFIQDSVLNFFHQISLASQRGFRDG